MLAKIKSLLGKQLIEEVNSPISGEIRIFKVLGRPRLVVGGMEQSGAFIGGIWKKGLKRIFNFHISQKSRKAGVPIFNVLILGLGGGTVAQLVSRFWPRAKIVGVEIDPVVIKLGEKYFALDKIPNLKIINADAAAWVKNKGEFDLILVDVYLADKVPRSCETKEFLKRIKQLLSPAGLAIFNRLFYQEKKQEAEEFIKRLEKIFPKISLTRTPSNLLIITQKRYN